MPDVGPVQTRQYLWLVTTGTGGLPVRLSCSKDTRALLHDPVVREGDHTFMHPALWVCA